MEQARRDAPGKACCPGRSAPAALPKAHRSRWRAHCRAACREKDRPGGAARDDPSACGTRGANTSRSGATPRALASRRKLFIAAGFRGPKPQHAALDGVARAASRHRTSPGRSCMRCCGRRRQSPFPAIRLRRGLASFRRSARFLSFGMIGMRQIDDLLAVMDPMFFRDHHAVGDDVIDEGHAHRAGIAEIVHLHGRRPVRRGFRCACLPYSRSDRWRCRSPARAAWRRPRHRSWPAHR